MRTTNLGLPQVVTRADWLVARKDLLAREKAASQARDALNAERRQLIIHHFMFDPQWDEGCDGCSFFVDNIPHLETLAESSADGAESRGTF